VCAIVLSSASHRLQLAEAKDRKARKAAQQTVSQAKGRLGKYEERLKELAATPGVPKVEVGSLEEVCRYAAGHEVLGRFQPFAAYVCGLLGGITPSVSHAPRTRSLLSFTA